jgi:hypothetical protein
MDDMQKMTSGPKSNTAVFDYPKATKYSDTRMTQKVPQSSTMAHDFWYIVFKTLWNTGV